jgi:hypothetical protein
MIDCTIIIPTLEICPEITDILVKEICENSIRSKILFINNSAIDTISQKYKKYKNVCVDHSIPNLMVNPAWNYGMTKVDTNYYLLLNDDVIFHGNLVDKIIQIFDVQKNIGLCTVYSKVLYDLQIILKEMDMNKIQEIEIDKKTYPNEIKQGWFMFGKTEDWVPINCNEIGDSSVSVEEKSITGGDDFVYKKIMNKYGSVVFVKNNIVYHCESSTVHQSNKNKDFYFQKNKKFNVADIAKYFI